MRRAALLLLLFSGCTGEVSAAGDGPPKSHAAEASATAPATAAAEAAPASAASAPRAAALKLPARPKPAQPVEENCREASGGACRVFGLDPFYAALEKTARGDAGAVTRVSHFGDSIIVSDYISTTVKRRLQADFGDAGRGFVYAGFPRFYYLSDVKHSATGLQVRSAFDAFIKDHRYGLGGAAFIAAGAGASATFATSKDTAFGQKASRLELFFLKQPGGGEVELSADTGEKLKVSAAAEAPENGYAALSAPLGERKFKARVTKGPVRLYGGALETDGPGVVYDAMGLMGNTVYAMLRPEAAPWQEQLAHRDPDLVVVELGANETGYVGTSKKGLEDFDAAFREFIGRIRAGAPEAACLVFGVMDGTKPAFARISDAQRAAAKDAGCAFWDARAMMIAKGGAKTWKKRGHLGPDGIHPSPKGAEIIGDALADALVDGFFAYLDR